MLEIWKQPLLRFIIVGVLNTLHYYLLYLFFIHLLGLNYLVAHILAFLISMIGSFFMNSYFTYQTKPTLKKFFQFPLTYVVNISVSTSSAYFFVSILNWDKDISPLLASLVAIPFTFIVSKKILKTQNDI
ncbi:Putative flippase GtrA (transmembrane translocase of bactoprenol-linked glucose) [Seinonella peptonophila]|uniref:Putative flippase GtrA (Transmembrane translocase of bactoprenol-linked glucose) n=1 Tax=Seinonella peptonophila TaxID=112248 RepID=A0A1M4XA13_9BACL|nr:GtrA family protein [Seinonella peptonophila]SHE90313.1 Putative flippase GtrA (transmembrane translocase of bactoprenol-linked glucose) [Seinonella peptonophila]